MPEKSLLPTISDDQGSELGEVNRHGLREAYAAEIPTRAFLVDLLGASIVHYFRSLEQTSRNNCHLMTDLDAEARQWLRVVFEAEARETLTDNRACIDVRRLASMQNHLRGVIIGQLPSERLAWQYLTYFSRYEILLDTSTNVDERHVRVLQSNPIFYGDF